MNGFNMTKEDILQYKNIYCYGAGDCFKRFWQRINKVVPLKGVLDSDEEKCNMQLYDDIKCYHPRNVSPAEDTLVIITIDSYDIVKNVETLLRELEFVNIIHISVFYEMFFKDEDRIRRKQGANHSSNRVLKMDVETIDPKEVTFVVTGRMNYEGDFSSDRCIKSIKEYYPDSQIVLSTWKGENTEPVRGLCNDILLMDEPKEYYEIYTKKSKLKKQNSVNLQQLSVSSGIKRVRTKYAVRIRSDYCLINDRMIEFYEKQRKKMPYKDRKYILFKQRLLSLDTFMYDPWVFNGGNSYTISDCFQFGLTEDLMLLWDGHREKEEDLTYFGSMDYLKEDNPYDFSYRFNPEQCLLINAIKTYGLNIKLPEYYFERNNLQVVYDYEKFIASNMIVGNHEDLGLNSRFTNIYPYLLYEREDIEDIYNNYL